MPAETEGSDSIAPCEISKERTSVPSPLWCMPSYLNNRLSSQRRLKSAMKKILWGAQADESQVCSDSNLLNHPTPWPQTGMGPDMKMPRISLVSRTGVQSLFWVVQIALCGCFYSCKYNDFCRAWALSN